MIDPRLVLALDAGGLRLPETGTIAVYKPSSDASLDLLPRDRTQVIEGFKPFHDNWVQRGFTCLTEAQGPFSAAIVCLPRSKSDAQAMIAQAMALTTGPVVIDGQKNEGVDSILKAMRRRVAISAPVSKAHGKLFWCLEPDADAFSDWRAGPELTKAGFWSAPGVFSADAVDPASALLADMLPDRLGQNVADLGAGWGFLSAHVLTRPDIKAVHLVEAEHIALECARRNVTDSRAVFHWADAAIWVSPVKMDAVVMNPPFHTSRAAEPGLGQSFVRAAAALLTPQGHLWMVANRHLPYEQTLQAVFATVTELGGDARFKLLHATRPRRGTRSAP